MNRITINPNKLYTPTAYGNLVGASVQLVRYWIKISKIKTIKINGATLIILE